MAGDGLGLEGGGDGPTVFFSYSRMDQKRALPIIRALEAAGIRVWWDGLLEGGDTFLPTTEAALESATAVIVLWSTNSVSSHWVRDEATRGRDRRCLVPLSLDDTQPPLGFRQFQVIDVSKWRGKPDTPEMDRILRAVQAGVGSGPAAPPRSSPPPRVSRRMVVGGGLAVGSAAVAAIAYRSGLLDFAKGGENSIAVLPFKNLSSDAEQGYFSDGLSEELRGILARNRMLRVAAPTSSSGLREQADDAISVSRKLGVAYVLRGSVQRSNNMVRISAELINGRDAVVRWSQIFNREMRDIFALQSEIANTVAIALVAEVAGQETATKSANAQQAVGGTTNIAAYDAYLRGRALFDLSAGEESDRAALKQFETAIVADPDYAAAHAMRATMLSAIANETGKANEVRSLYDAAIAAARRSVALAPKLASGHSALGFAMNNGHLDPAAAQPSYEKARELAGGDADILRGYATFTAYNGHPAEAATVIAKVLTLDPLNARAFRSAGNIAFAARDYSSTIAAMQQALKLNPKISAASVAIGNAHYLNGRLPEAIAAYQAEPAALFAQTGLAIAQHRAGNRAAAQAALNRLRSEFGNNSFYQQGEVLAQWGDVDGAFARLDQARKLMDSGLLLTPTDPMLDPLRADPRFADLLSWLEARKF